MPAITRTLTAAALAVFIAPLAPRAEPLGWADVFSPDRIAQTVLQYGIMALRTQLDLKYGDMTVNLLGNRITMTDLQIWPRPDWDRNVACEIRVDRLNLIAAPLDQTRIMRFKIAVFGATAPAVCLPREARGILAAARLREVSLPHVNIDIAYDVATAGARIQANGVLENVAAFDAAGDFSYLWFDGRRNIENPDPVIKLSAASVSLENLGGWKTASAMLPPPVTNPDSAAQAVTGMLTSMIGGMNRPRDGSSDTPPLTPEQADFIASAATAWTGFLKNPRRIVLEAGIPEGESVFVDFEQYNRQPAAIFADLRPRISLAPAPARATLPIDLLRAALGDNAQNLAPTDRLRVGMALVSGLGAPRNIAAGADILVALAGDGDAEAARALSEVLESRQPEQAYGWALRAGAAGFAGATARLDRLEGVLPLSQVLAIQSEASKDASHPLSALASVAAIKRQARQRLTGKGQTRSYGIAAMWAMLAAATGDAEAADILDEIDQRVRFADADSANAWADIEAQSSRLALSAWLSRNLPSVLGGGN